jgi:SOS regulatory protein LexA
MTPDYKTKIRHFYRKHRRMPTWSEIMELCGFKSKHAVTKLVQRLAAEGFLRKDAKGFLLPGNIYSNVKVLGVITAGWPSPAEEELIDTMTIDEFLIDNRDATYMLRVQGDSMKDVGIMDGDTVLVERTTKYKAGDIVVAEVDEEWTVKFLRKNRTGFYLEPANKDYAPLYPASHLTVAAVVKAVIRKY